MDSFCRGEKEMTRFVKVWWHCLFRMLEPGHRMCQIELMTGTLGPATIHVCECETDPEFFKAFRIIK